MSGRATWEMSQDQFALAWRTTGHDVVPVPLRVRPTARTEGERQARMPALNAWWSALASGGSDIGAVLRVLAAPFLGVQVFASDDPPSGVFGAIGVYGAIRGQNAVVVVQKPGRNEPEHARLTVRALDPADLPAAIVSELPPREAGRVVGGTASEKEIRCGDQATIMYNPYRLPTGRRLRGILTAPRHATGHLVITRNDGTQPRPREVLSWIDTVDDGRYLVRPGHDVQVIPADRNTFVEQLARLVGPSVTDLG